MMATRVQRQANLAYLVMYVLWCSSLFCLLSFLGIYLGRQDLAYGMYEVHTPSTTREMTSERIGGLAMDQSSNSTTSSKD